MSAVSFVVPGRIGGKGRPRFSSRNGVVRSYTPEKTRATESMIREIASRAIGDAPLLEGALSLRMDVRLRTPKSWPKKRRDAAVWVTGKPDCDNTLKLVDALNGIIFHDDSQIAKVEFERRFVADGQESVSFIIEELGGE